jgi:hypothetical protein
VNNTQAIALVVCALVGATFCAIQLRRALKTSDYRTRNDAHAAERTLQRTPPGEQQTPGTDHQLLLDCIAVYGDHEGLQRLRNAINNHREGEE